jgi:hypothetical protein
MFLGCGCKNKVEQQKPTMVQTNNVIELVELEEPPYELEEVQRVREYFFSKFKQETERNYAVEWNKTYFEPQQIGYCDAACLNRIKDRAEFAYKKIQDYVNWKTSRETS